MPIDPSGERYDLIIVGAGGSGLAAAIESAQAGAKALLLEKAQDIGGATALSVGTYSSSSTENQRRLGIDDSPSQHCADMELVNANAKKPDNSGLRRLLVYGAPVTFKWLTDIGLEFVGPGIDPPQTRPRLHNVIPSSSAFSYHLGRKCRQLGVTIRCNSRVVDLLFDGERVIGVTAKAAGTEPIDYYSHNGVILTTGDFAASPEYRSRFFDKAVVNAVPAYPLAMGDGLRIGEKYGAHIVNGDYAAFYIPRLRFIPPAQPNWLLRLPPSRFVTSMIKVGMAIVPSAIMRPFIMRFITTILGPEQSLFRAGAAMVNSSGSLIQVEIQSPAKNLALDPSNSGFIILDNRVAKLFESWPNFVSTAPGVAFAYMNDYRVARPDVFHEAPTLEGLARTIGVKPESLTRAISEHNRSAVEPLEQGPFIALGPVRGYISITEGGLAVTDDLRVLGENAEPIPGLYAAGSAGQGGVLLDGHGHHLAWAFVSGRQAARTAMQIKQPLY
jgi:succinate dehydrogenase/fumarate reductase flavoprotein subunit